MISGAMGIKKSMPQANIMNRSYASNFTNIKKYNLLG